MARMIPPSYTTKTTSPGERLLFDKLKNDQATDKWIVLHSLDITQHSRIQGEADFVILIPNKGILCVEVKAHQKIRRDTTGYWYYGTNDKKDARGPFKQASEAMHSLRKQLISNNPQFSRIVFWSCVLFTHTNFDIISNEWHSWQVIDTTLFNSYPINYLFEEVLNQARNFLSTHPQMNWYEYSNSPTILECEEITQILRPAFDFFESPYSRSQNLNKELKQYTAEQYNALDRMAANPRVIFNGPAGTGKTLVAIEAVRRASEANIKTLFLCFNTFLGEWLQEQTVSLAHNVKTRTLHSHLLQVADIKAPSNANTVFWQETLPTKALTTLQQDTSGSHQYDLIVIDEAQDVLRESYLFFLTKSLRSGLTRGKWFLFGDFKNQAIFNSATISFEDFHEKWTNFAPIYFFQDNCRNTPNIAEYIHLLGALNPRYTKILRPNSEFDPQLYFYKDRVQQEELLIRELEQLEKDGFLAKEIVILSPKAHESCAEQLEDVVWRDRLKHYRVSKSENTTKYCSIKAFKGLEAPAIIITDIDHISTQESLALFYVGISRAVERLSILVYEEAKKDLVQILDKQREKLLVSDNKE